MSTSQDPAPERRRLPYTRPPAIRDQFEADRSPVEPAPEPITSASAAPPAAAPTSRPRSLADLRTGILADREFASMQDFAVAAVVEGRYSTSTIAHLFKVPAWRLEEWVERAASTPAATTAPARRVRGQTATRWESRRSPS